MSYVALYRVWRPAKWQDVVDQKATVRILKNALGEGKLSHAYLFSGPRGTGKTTVARLLAKSVNCSQLEDGEPCNKCRSCLSISSGTSVDVTEIDAASNRGIDEMRSLRESVRYLPVIGTHKVYIIDEVHMLTQEAFNALLKTLEEPPEHVIFVLATTAPHKIPVTITSRCQRLDFHRFSIGDIEKQLQKILSSEGASKVTWEGSALRVIARAAGGSMRDALSILDLCLTYGEGRITEGDVREILGDVASEVMMRLFTAISQRDLRCILGVTKEMSDRGKDMGELAQEIGAFARDLLLVKTGAKPSDIGRPDDEVKEMTVIARAMDPRSLVLVIEAAGKAAADMRASDDPRLTLEMALLSLFLDETGPKILFPEAPGSPADVKMSKGASVLLEKQDHEPSREVPVVSNEAAEHAGKAEDVHEPSTGLLPMAKPESQADAIEIVKQAWPRVLEEMFRKRKVKVRAYLLHATPSRVEHGRKLILAYPKGSQILMEQIMQKENRTVVEQYVERVTGLKLDVEAEISQYMNGNGDGGNGNGDLHPLVKAAINILDGKVVR